MPGLAARVGRGDRRGGGDPGRGRRGDGRRGRGEHRGPGAGGGRARVRCWVDEATHAAGRRRRSAFADAGEHALKGKAEPQRAVAGDPGAGRGGRRASGSTGWRRRWSAGTRSCAWSRSCSTPREERRAPRLVLVSRRGRGGQVAAGLGVREVRRRAGRDGVVAPGPVPVLRRGRGVLGAGRGGPRPARAGGGDTGRRRCGRRLDDALAELRGRRARSATGCGRAWPPWSGLGRGCLRSARTCSPPGRRSSSGSARAEPVVLVIDDAQHADEGVARLPRTPAHRRRRRDLRPGPRPTRAAGRGGPTSAAVGPRSLRLDRSPTPRWRRWSTAWWRAAGDDARRPWSSGAEGIPLFAVETVRALIDRDVVVPRDGPLRACGGASLDLDAIGRTRVPAGPGGRPAGRADSRRSDRSSRPRASSGLPFTRDGLAALSGGGATTSTACWPPCSARRSSSRSRTGFSAERGQYRFVQTVVRQVAYAPSPGGTARRRHLAGRRLPRRASRIRATTSRS